MDHIRLLGSTEAYVGGRRVAGRDFGGAKVRQVLEILALTPGRPVAKDQLAELLWEGAPPPSWLATLEAYVSQLRRALAPDVPAPRSPRGPRARPAPSAGPRRPGPPVRRGHHVRRVPAGRRAGEGGPHRLRGGGTPG